MQNHLRTNDIDFNSKSKFKFKFNFLIGEFKNEISLKSSNTAGKSSVEFIVSKCALDCAYSVQYE